MSSIRIMQGDENMKFRIIIAVVLIASLLCALSACSKDKDKDEPLTGVYVITDITDDPDGVTLAELKEMYDGMGINIEDYLNIEIMEGDYFLLTLFGDEEAFGTYTRDGSTLTLTDSNGEALTMTLSGGKLTWIYINGAKLVFEKKIEIQT